MLNANLQLKICLFLILTISITSVSAQGNPNATSIFSRIEAIVLSQLLEEPAVDYDKNIWTYNPEWIESNPPSKMTTYYADQFGAIGQAFADVDGFVIVFDRLSDCRIKEIKVIFQNENSTVQEQYRASFEYNEQNRTILVTFIIEDFVAGNVDLDARVIYHYDANEFLTKYEEFSYNTTSSTWDLSSTIELVPDNCGNYTKTTKKSNTGVTIGENQANRIYVPNGCLQDSAAIINVLSGNIIEEYKWGYTSNGDLKSLMEFDPPFCLQYTYEYDAFNRRTSIKEGDCGSQPDYTLYSYGWNANNSLAWIDLYPSPGDTFPRLVVEYGTCSVSSTENTLVKSNITISSPVLAGSEITVWNLPENNYADWQLTNSTGQYVSSGIIMGPTATLSLNTQIPPGLYVISVQSRNQTFTRKLIIN